MSAKILFCPFASIAALILLPLGFQIAAAQDPVQKPAALAAPTGLNGLLDIGKMAQAAPDLRKAGELGSRRA